jgi:hypothetical protein
MDSPEGDLRLAPAASSSRLGGALEVSEPVAPPLDVEHAAVMEQPIQDGRGQDLVTGEDSWQCWAWRWSRRRFPLGE